MSNLGIGGEAHTVFILVNKITHENKNILHWSKFEYYNSNQRRF